MITSGAMIQTIEGTDMLKYRKEPEIGLPIKNKLTVAPECLR